MNAIITTSRETISTSGEKIFIPPMFYASHASQNMSRDARMQTPHHRKLSYLYYLAKINYPNTLVSVTGVTKCDGTSWGSVLLRNKSKDWYRDTKGAMFVLYVGMDKY
jgi:hypothetical protein